MVDPNKERFYLTDGRWKTIKRFKNKHWRRSHINFAYKHNLTLETMQLLFDLGYVLHHIDQNKQNDYADNLKLLNNKKHMSLHTKGRYRHKLGNNKIIDLVINRKIPAAVVAKTFNVSPGTIRNRLHSMGYDNLGSCPRPYWKKKEDNIIDYHYNIDEQVEDLVIRQKLTGSGAARILKVSESTVRSRLVKLGYKNVSPRGSYYPLWAKADEDIKKMKLIVQDKIDKKNKKAVDLVVGQKLSTFRAAKTLKVSKGTIYNRLIKANYRNFGSCTKPMWKKVSSWNPINHILIRAG